MMIAHVQEVTFYTKIAFKKINSNLSLILYLIVMLIGKNIEGGIYGDYGSLDGPSDSLSASIDFRDVHNSILTNWISPKSLSHQNKQFSPLTVGISHCV